MPQLICNAKLPVDKNKFIKIVYQIIDGFCKSFGYPTGNAFFPLLSNILGTFLREQICIKTFLYTHP